jgi:rod shape-determining protein MreB
MGLFACKTGSGSREIAVDLGTANTLVYVRGQGVVLSEPSIVAVESGTGRPYAVGIQAKHILDCPPGGVAVISPLSRGVIANLELTAEMLRRLIKKLHRNRDPRVVACVPSDVTALEKRAVLEAFLSAGARETHLIKKPLAAAIGAGLPVEEPTGSFVLDIGAATSEVAGISFGGIVASKSIPVGGDDFDKAIITYVKREHQLLIGTQTAEEIKFEIGSAFPTHEATHTEIHGRDRASQAPKTILLTSEEIRSELEKPLAQIIAAVKETLSRTPPELAGDIIDRGITLAGGGSLLHGLEHRLREEIQMPVRLAESPHACVVNGSGRSLERRQLRS